MNNKWKKVLENVDVAFQPIVDIHTGRLYGVESLLREYDKAGFSSIDSLFESAYQDKLLFSFDIELRKKVFKKFKKMEFYKKTKLFYNVDNRVITMPDYKPGLTSQILKDNNLFQDSIIFELSEKHEISNYTHMEKIICFYKQYGHGIALDDFGTGYAGLKMLYHSLPNIIKIDRFFINDINSDITKKKFVNNIIKLASVLGTTIVAEGIETVEEYYTCKEIGANLIQGYLIQKPIIDEQKIFKTYPYIKELAEKDRRSLSIKKSLKQHIEKIKSVDINTEMIEVLEKFKDKEVSILPIVDHNNVPHGIILENTLKKYVYSKYGRSILQNDKDRKKIKNFIIKCPITDINSPIEELLENFSYYKDAKGIIITKNMKYYGYLKSTSLLHIINERNILLARDQNPLSRLPGNHKIKEYTSKALNDKNDYIFVYFDFNHFKP